MVTMTPEDSISRNNWAEEGVEVTGTAVVFPCP